MNLHPDLIATSWAGFNKTPKMPAEYYRAKWIFWKTVKFSRRKFSTASAAYEYGKQVVKRYRSKFNLMKEGDK